MIYVPHMLSRGCCYSSRYIFTRPNESATSMWMLINQIVLELHPTFWAQFIDDKEMNVTCLEIHKNDKKVLVKIQDYLLSTADPLVLESIFRQVKAGLGE